MINAGMVSVENGRKDGGPNDYVPTKKVRVDLSFIVETPDQAEATLDYVLSVAHDRVNKALGLAGVPVRVVTRAEVEKATLGEQIAHAAKSKSGFDAEFEAKVKAKIAREKEANALAEAGHVVEAAQALVLGPEITASDVKAREAAAVKEPEKPKSTDAIVLDTSLPAALKREQPAKDNAALVVEPPKPAVEAPKTAVISDADIMKAITTINAQVKNPKAIVALIHKHTAELAPEKHTASQIPQDRRAQFIDDLELLKVSGPTVA